MILHRGTHMSIHEARIGILRRMGYASLVFWPGALMGHYPHNEDLIIALLPSYGILPFITARVAKRAFRQGRILKAYVVSALTAIPVAALLLYVLGVLIFGILFYAYGLVAGLAFFIWDTLLTKPPSITSLSHFLFQLVFRPSGSIAV